MDVTVVVRQSLKVLEDADVPESLRATALPAIIELMARHAPGSPAMALIPYDSAAAHPQRSEDLVERLARRLAVDREVVEGVYTSDGSTLDISVNPARLPRSKSTGTKALALLLTALRQGAGDEEFTAVDDIRRLAQEFGRYDGPNFASAITEMRGVFLVKGPARQRALKLTRPGWQQAADLVRELGEGRER